MKETIENSIKQSLENFEAPYNANAWAQMNARLDAQMPTTPKSTTKWYVAASAIVVVATASYFLFTGETNSTEDQSNIAQLDENSTTENTTEVTTSSESNNDVNNTASDENNTTQTSNEIGNEVTNEITIDPFPIFNGPVNAGGNGTGTNPNDNLGLTPSNGGNNPGTSPNDNGGDQTSTETSSALVVPRVADMCQGETFVVINTNDAPLLVLGPDMYFMIPANEERTLRANKSGNYTIGALESGTGTERIEFMVNDAPGVDFTIDGTTKFENGLPTTIVESTGAGSEFEWIFGGQKINGNTAEAHFYTKGEHSITLTVTGNNGCTSTETKTVYVEDNYNLMAVNSFRPNSNNPQTNTFMPYALTERNVQFTLIIIDPTDGHVVYETSDATQGWDGVDKRSGQLVAFENSYIWKVTIQKLQPGEASNDYSGHVIPVHSNN
ncbi:MAG: PKD domain-containing protein [Crocinitomicaceae bacterium]|nr:PKD domain-containing protein [Crocinitomicaceae bacterium]